MGTHGLCPRFLNPTHVDITHRLGFRGTKVLHVIRKLFLIFSLISLRLNVSLISLYFSKSKQIFSRDLIFSFFSSSPFLEIFRGTGRNTETRTRGRVKAKVAIYLVMWIYTHLGND